MGGTASELLRHVRPEMRQLLRDALDAQMFVAIVTLSPQTRLIREITQLLFPKDFQLIIIRGNDGNWFYRGQGSSRGKQPHIASAVEELSHAHAAQISRRHFVETTTRRILTTRSSTASTPSYMRRTPRRACSAASRRWARPDTNVE